MSKTRLHVDATSGSPDNLELTPDAPFEIVFAEDVELDTPVQAEDRNHALTPEPPAFPPVERKDGESPS